MQTFLIVAAIVALLLLGVLLAAWNAPEGEETKEGFQILGPSKFQRFKTRVRMRLRRRAPVGDLTHDHNH